MDDYSDWDVGDVIQVMESARFTREQYERLRGHINYVLENWEEVENGS